MKKSIIRKLITARRKGLAWCILCKPQSFILNFIRIIFKFDRWHSDNGFYCRPYKKHVADFVSSLNPMCVVEVGCGLGDIISSIRCRNHIGIELDSIAINAAKLIHPFRKRVDLRRPI